MSELVMGCEQNLREMNVKVISRFNTCVKRQLYELQFSWIFVILSKNFESIHVNLGENGKNLEISFKQNFTT